MMNKYYGWRKIDDPDQEFGDELFESTHFVLADSSRQAAEHGLDAWMRQKVEFDHVGGDPAIVEVQDPNGNVSRWSITAKQEINYSSVRMYP
jgi:hypothetical protein